MEASRAAPGPAAERLAYSVDEAAQLTGLSRDLLYDQMRRGNLPYVKIGRRRLITRQHLQQFLGICPNQTRSLLVKRRETLARLLLPLFVQFGNRPRCAAEVVARAGMTGMASYILAHASIKTAATHCRPSWPRDSCRQPPGGALPGTRGRRGGGRREPSASSLS